MYPDQETQNGYGGYPDEFQDYAPRPSKQKQGFRLSAWKSLIGVLILGYVVSLATCRGPQTQQQPAAGPTNNINIENLTSEQLGEIADQLGVEVEDLGLIFNPPVPETQSEVYQIYSADYLSAVYQARESVEAELHRWARCRAASIHADVIDKVENTPGVTSAQDVFIQRLELRRDAAKAAADGKAFYRHSADSADAFRDPATDAYALLMLLTAFTEPEPAVPLCQQDTEYLWDQVDRVIAEYKKDSANYRTIGGSAE
jgi:hypothetical protein